MVFGFCINGSFRTFKSHSLTAFGENAFAFFNFDKTMPGRDVYYLTRIKKPRYNAGCICKSGRNYHIAVHAVCVFRENTLPRRKESVTKQTNLSSVAMTAENKIYLSVFEIEIAVFRVMTQQYFVSGLQLKIAEPRCVGNRLFLHVVGNVYIGVHFTVGGCWDIERAVRSSAGRCKAAYANSAIAYIIVVKNNCSCRSDRGNINVV